MLFLPQLHEAVTENHHCFSTREALLLQAGCTQRNYSDSSLPLSQTLYWKTVFFSISCTPVDILKTYSTGLPLFHWCSAGAETGLPSCRLENVMRCGPRYILFSVSFHSSVFVICLFFLYRFVFLCAVFGFTSDFILFAPTWVCSVTNLLLLDVYMFSFLPLSLSLCQVTLCVFTLQVFPGLFLLLFWVLALLSF